MAGGEHLVMGKSRFLQRMGEGIVADVVQQRGQTNRQPFLGVSLSQLPDDATRQVIGAEGVLETGVGRAGID